MVCRHLARRRVRKWYQNGTEEEINQKRKLLFSWGYGKENLKGNPEPFYSKHKGILSTSTFVSLHSSKVEGILFDVEPFYVATTLGLLAVDILTTTGARINELLQLNSEKDCLRAIKLNGDLKFSFYVIPKGRDALESYPISKQTFELIKRVHLMLKGHYNGKFQS